MRLTRSTAAGWGVVVLSLILTACAENEEPSTPSSVESAAAPASTASPTSEATATEYRVVLDVGYRQTLRFPGSGHLPRELELDYRIDTSTSVGPLAEPAVEGSAAWTIRCYSDEAISDPDASPEDEQTGNPPFAVATADSQFPNPEALEPEVDWLAEPGVLLLEHDDALVVAHRLPSSVALGETVDMACTGSVSASTVDWGHGAMTAPARVNIGGDDYSRAEALNLGAESPVYLIDPRGDGWLLARIARDELAAGSVEINFLREESEPEGEKRLAITGTIERNER